MPSATETRQTAALMLITSVTSQNAADMIAAGIVTPYRAYEATEAELEAIDEGLYAIVQAYRNPQ